MSRVSPTLEGFRAAFRRPSLTFAEITWRWVIGATATVLFFFGMFEFLSTLPVNRGEMLFLRTRQPYLVTQALLHILRGGWRRGMLSLLVAAVLITVLWMIAASLGRIATVRTIIEYFRERLPGKSENSESGELKLSSKAFDSLLLLNFFRAVVGITTVCGFLGAGILASFVSSDAHPRPGLAFLVFLPIAAVVGLLAWALNWLLSLAAVFAVRDGQDAVGAVATAITLFADRMGAVLAVSCWVGLAHLVLFIGATTVVSIPLGFIPLVPWRLAVLAMLLVTLAYLAVADWLYMARLAGYVCIAEMTDDMFVPVPPPAPPTALEPVQTTIDRDELILSDLPHLA